MNFSNALNGLMAGHRMTRTGWNEPEMHVVRQDYEPDNPNHSHFWLVKADGTRSPWVPSNGDLFATDWTEV